VFFFYGEILTQYAILEYGKFPIEEQNGQREKVKGTVKKNCIPRKSESFRV